MPTEIKAKYGLFIVGEESSIASAIKNANKMPQYVHIPTGILWPATHSAPLIWPTACPEIEMILSIICFWPDISLAAGQPRLHRTRTSVRVRARAMASSRCLGLFFQGLLLLLLLLLLLHFSQNCPLAMSHSNYVIYRQHFAWLEWSFSATADLLMSQHKKKHRNMANSKTQ